MILTRFVLGMGWEKNTRFGRTGSNVWKDAPGESVVSVGRVVVAIKDAQPLARVIALDSLAIELRGG